LILRDVSSFSMEDGNRLDRLSTRRTTGSAYSRSKENETPNDHEGDTAMRRYDEEG